MNIYKAMLNCIVKPLFCGVDVADLRQFARKLQGSEGKTDNISWAVGEMLMRALMYVDMTLDVLEETKGTNVTR